MDTPMTIHIKAAGYENIYFDCGHCGYENVLNRATELGTMPIDGREVSCQNCMQRVWINFDIIQMADYQWFLRELPILKQKKLYRDYALTLCQGAENFFLQAIINKKFDREPKYRNSDGWLDPFSQYNGDLAKFKETIKNCPFDCMRTKFLNTFADVPTGAFLESSGIKEDKRDWAFTTIKQSTINKLRNEVTHKNAYRPTLQEIEAHEPLVEALEWLGIYLKVYDSDYILNTPLNETGA